MVGSPTITSMLLSKIRNLRQLSVSCDFVNSLNKDKLHEIKPSALHSVFVPPNRMDENYSFPCPIAGRKSLRFLGCEPTPPPSC